MENENVEGSTVGSNRSFQSSGTLSDKQDDCKLTAMYSDDDDDDDDMDDWDEDEPSRKKRRGSKKERNAGMSEEETERRRVLANSQERERMNRLNRALSNLRRALPPHLSVSSRRLSKIRTLRMAVTYIRGLTALLDEDRALSQGCAAPPPPSCQQPVYPPGYYPAAYPPVYPAPYPFPEAARRVSVMPGGDKSADEGYFSSSFSESPHVQATSFLSPCLPALITPFQPHSHPALHPVTATPEEGYPPSFLLSPPTPSFSPNRCSWLSSTPLTTHPPSGHLVPAPPFTGSETVNDSQTGSFITGRVAPAMSFRYGDNVDDSLPSTGFYAVNSQHDSSFPLGTVFGDGMSDSQNGPSFPVGTTPVFHSTDNDSGSFPVTPACFQYSARSDDSKNASSFLEPYLSGGGRVGVQVMSTPESCGKPHTTAGHVPLQAGYLSPGPLSTASVQHQQHQQQQQQHHHRQQQQQQHESSRQCADWSSSSCPPELSLLSQ